MTYRGYEITAELATTSKWEIDESGVPTEWLDYYDGSADDPIKGFNIDAVEEAADWQDVLEGYTGNFEDAKARIDQHLDHPERCVDCHRHAKALMERVHPTTA